MLEEKRDIQETVEEMSLAEQTNELKRKVDIAAPGLRVLLDNTMGTVDYTEAINYMVTKIDLTEPKELALMALVLIDSLVEQAEQMEKKNGHRIQPGQQIALKKELDAEKMKEMRYGKDKYTIPAIAKYFGCSVMTVRRKLGLTDNGLTKKGGN